MFCRKKCYVVVLFALSLATPAVAQSTAEEVRQINEEIAVLQARLSKIDVEAKIAAKEAEKLRSSGAGAFGRNEFHAGEDTPVVKAIDGMDGKLTATLVMRGGAVQTVRVGEKVGAWTTKAITVNSVTLSRGKETVRLAFGTEPAAGSNGGFGATGPGSPAALPRQ